MTESTERIVDALAVLSDTALNLLIEGLPGFVYTPLFSVEASRRMAYLEEPKKQHTLHLITATPEIFEANLKMIGCAIEYWELRADDVPAPVAAAHLEARKLMALLEADIVSVLDQVKKLQDGDGGSTGPQQERKE